MRGTNRRVRRDRLTSDNFLPSVTRPRAAVIVLRSISHIENSD